MCNTNYRTIKVIATIQAMPENEFEDIDVVLERLVDVAREEREKNVLHEPAAVYETSYSFIEDKQDDSFVTTHTDEEMMAHIDKKLNEATDPEAIFLIKKIKRSLENVQAGNFYTIEEAQAKINSWFKK